MPHVDTNAPLTTNSDAAMWRQDHASAIRYIEDLLRERQLLAPVIEAANERIKELQEGAPKADVEPLDLEAIESRAHRLMIATWGCDKLSYTDQWQLTRCDVPGLVADVRRLHAELDAANKHIKELEEGAVKANELIHLYKNQRDENDQEAQECADHCLALEAEVARLRPLAQVGEAVEALPVGFGLSHAADDLWLVWDSRELEDELDETCGETALTALQKLAALRGVRGGDEG